MSTNSDFFNTLRMEVYANQLITSFQILIEKTSYNKAHEILSISDPITKS